MIQQVKDGSVIAEFENYNQASTSTSIDGSSISKCCNGKRKTAGGYEWRFAKKDVVDPRKEKKEYVQTAQILKEENHKTLVNFKSKDELRFDAYEKAVNEKPEIMSFLTWSTLLAIEVMALSYDSLILSLKEDGIYKMEVKKIANECMSELKSFMSNIKKQCYNGDESVVVDEAVKSSMELFKLRMSISNYLHKYKLDYNLSISTVKVCQGITDLIQSMHDHRKEYLKSINPNLDFSAFMKPTRLSSSINNLADVLSKKYNQNVGIVDLNNDICIKNGIHSIDNILNDKERITNLVIKIYEFNRNK